MFLEQHPTSNTRCNQYAGGYRKQRALSPEFVRFSESRKVAVAWAARAEVIQPLLGFAQRHLSRRDSLEHIWARTPRTLRIRKLFEQTSAQCIQDAPFLSRRISLYVQTCLPLQTLRTCSEKIHPVDLSRTSWFFLLLAIQQCSAEFFPIRTGTSFLLVAR